MKDWDVVLAFSRKIPEESKYKISQRTRVNLGRSCYKPMNNTQTADQKKHELEGFAIVCYVGVSFPFLILENIYTYIYTKKQKK